MSIVANKMIIDSLTEKLKDTVTYGEMAAIADAVADVLSGYEITPNIIEDTGSDYMLDAFVEALSVEGRSEKTIERYRYILTRMLKALGVNSRGVTQYHIRKYLSDEKQRGISDNTIKGYCWVFSSYFGWLHRDGLIDRNPMGNIGNIRVQQKVREVFSDVDIEKLKMHCTCTRDKAIICFLKSTGCRISEVVGLNRDDIDFANLECIVLGKGNKQRTVYIDAVTAMVLKTYLDERTDSSPALFAGKGTERIHPGGIRSMLKAVGARAGVNHVHPHKFRATEITDLVNRGMPIELVKSLAGHKKIDTTMQYVKIDQLNVKNSYHKYA